MISNAVAYVCDFEHGGPAPEKEMIDFVRDCDLVIYDTTFTVEDYMACKGWGHSTVEAGLALCAAAGAKRLAAFHHNPEYDDAKLAEIDTMLDILGTPYSGLNLSLSEGALISPADGQIMIAKGHGLTTNKRDEAVLDKLHPTFIDPALLLDFAE